MYSDSSPDSSASCKSYHRFLFSVFFYLLISPVNHHATSQSGASRCVSDGGVGPKLKMNGGVGGQRKECFYPRRRMRSFFFFFDAMRFSSKDLKGVSSDMSSRQDAFRFLSDMTSCIFDTLLIRQDKGRLLWERLFIAAINEVST